MVSAHGKRLATNRALHVRLEGNTDERGPAEYNIGPGERRATDRGSSSDASHGGLVVADGGCTEATGASACAFGQEIVG